MTKKQDIVPVDPSDALWQAERVDALFAPWSNEGMPGAAVAVVRHGEVILAKGFGLANIYDKVRIGPNTAFLLASVTKQFTALAVMRLVERGDLTYEHRLSEFFPTFPSYARTITVRHLLHHTAGLPEYEGLFVDTGKIEKGSYPRSIKTPASKFEPTSRQALNALSQQEYLLFNPGDRFLYTNSNYVVLAQIVEAVSGRQFPEFVKKEIFERAGMKHSLVPVEKWLKVPKRATSFSWQNGAYGDIDYTPLNLIYGDDGIYSTIHDMAQWDQALNSGTLVKQSTLREAFQSGKLNTGERTGYGFGWGLGPESISHTGAWLGFRTCIIRYLARRLTVIVLANCAELNAACMANDIAGLYLGPDENRLASHSGAPKWWRSSPPELSPGK